jgi:hypothetical protein
MQEYGLVRQTLRSTEILLALGMAPLGMAPLGMVLVGVGWARIGQAGHGIKSLMTPTSSEGHGI